MGSSSGISISVLSIWTMDDDGSSISVLRRRDRAAEASRNVRRRLGDQGDGGAGELRVVPPGAKDLTPYDWCVDGYSYVVGTFLENRRVLRCLSDGEVARLERRLEILDRLVTRIDYERKAGLAQGPPIVSR